MLSPVGDGPGTKNVEFCLIVSSLFGIKLGMVARRRGRDRSLGEGPEAHSRHQGSGSDQSDPGPSGSGQAGPWVFVHADSLTPSGFGSRRGLCGD